MTSLEQEITQSGIDQIKPKATIFDATSGNRTIWVTKESPYIIYGDLEPELEISPDKIIDCRFTDFLDESLFTIFFDPPHGWGKDPGKSFTAIKNLEEYRNYKWMKNKPNRNVFTYYGWDKYKTKSQLLGFIHKSQKEFYRILRKDGMLWLKWNECNISLGKILIFFKNWNEMLRIPVQSHIQNWGESQTYWIMFMRKSETIETLDLADFTNMPEKEASP